MKEWLRDAAIVFAVLFAVLIGLFFLLREDEPFPNIQTEPFNATLPPYIQQGGATYKEISLSNYLIEISKAPIAFYFESNGDGTCNLTGCFVKLSAYDERHIDFPATSPNGEKVIKIDILSEGSGRVPAALTVEQFKEIEAALDFAFDSGAISDNYKLLFVNQYTLIDIDKMTEGISNKAEREKKRKEILLQYPFAEIMSLYVLSDDVTKQDVNDVSNAIGHIDYTQKDCVNDYNEIISKIFGDKRANDAILRSVPRPYMSNWGNIESVSIPEGVQSICFDGCRNIRKLELPDSLTEICDNAFCESYLGAIDIPNGVKRIGKNAFLSCFNLSRITVPSGVTVIENETFSQCSGLMEVTLQEGVTTIRAGAFFGSKLLMTINIPRSISVMESTAFEGCKLLQSINYGGTKAEWEALVSKEENANWNEGMGTSCKVYCTDGVIDVSFDNN